MQETEEFLTNEDLSRRYKVPLNTVLYWRKYGLGPAGVVIGRHVRYRMAEVLAWEKVKVEKAISQ